MDLIRVHQLLIAANEQRHGSLWMAGPEDEAEIRWMVATGLVEAMLSDDGVPSFACITRVTAIGHAFLRAFERPPELTSLLPAPARSVADASATAAGLLEKWKVNFALRLRRPPQASKDSDVG